MPQAGMFDAFSVRRQRSVPIAVNSRTASACLAVFPSTPHAGKAEAVREFITRRRRETSQPGAAPRVSRPTKTDQALQGRNLNRKSCCALAGLKNENGAHFLGRCPRLACLTLSASGGKEAFRSRSIPGQRQLV